MAVQRIEMLIECVVISHVRANAL